MLLCYTENVKNLNFISIRTLKKSFLSSIENQDLFFFTLLILIGSLRQVKIPRARGLFAISE